MLESRPLAAGSECFERENLASGATEMDSRVVMCLAECRIGHNRDKQPKIDRAQPRLDCWTINRALIVGVVLPPFCNCGHPAIQNARCCGEVVAGQQERLENRVGGVDTCTITATSPLSH